MKSKLVGNWESLLCFVIIKFKTAKQQKVLSTCWCTVRTCSIGNRLSDIVNDLEKT